MVTKKTRLLLCCEQYYPSKGGVQEVMRQIAERLIKEEIEVTVVTSSYHSRPNEHTHNGVRIISFPITGNLIKGIKGPLIHYQSFVSNGNFDAILIKAAQQWTFDGVIDILPSLKCRKIFIPCGFSNLNNSLYAPYFLQMPNWLRFFNTLIFYSSDYQDINFAKRNKLLNINIISNGVDENEFKDLDDHNIRQRLGINPSHDLILTVGSQIEAKGHWELVNAFKMANLPRPTTLVINANNPGNKITRFRRMFKYAINGKWPLTLLAYLFRDANKHIVIVDLLRSDLIDLYKAANLFILASHVEYSPLVLFESSAAGTAFLATPAGNSKEIAEWTEGGVVMPLSNADSAKASLPTLVQFIENMLNDPENLKTLGERGRTNIFLNGFTWNQIIKKYKALILGEPL